MNATLWIVRVLAAVFIPLDAVLGVIAYTNHQPGNGLWQLGNFTVTLAAWLICERANRRRRRMAANLRYYR